MIGAWFVIPGFRICNILKNQYSYYRKGFVLNIPEQLLS